MGPDPGVRADPDRAQHGGADSEHHPVTDRRVPVTALGVAPPAAPAKGHVVVDGDVVADSRSLTNDYSISVVDEQAAADPGTGMNLHSGCRPGNLGEQAGQERHSPAMQSMRQPVAPQCPQSWVEDSFGRPDAVQGGISAPRCP